MRRFTPALYILWGWGGGGYSGPRALYILFGRTGPGRLGLTAGLGRGSAIPHRPPTRQGQSERPPSKSCGAGGLACWASVLRPRLYKLGRGLGAPSGFPGRVTGGARAASKVGLGKRPLYDGGPFGLGRF